MKDLLTSLLCFLFLISPILQAQTKISIGIFPRHNYSETIRMFLPISKHLSKELGIPVQLKTAKNFVDFWKNVENNTYDLVHFNQSQYLTAHEKSGYRILLMNEEFGYATLRSVIIVRKDSGIRTLSDLVGKNIIFGGNTTAMMSYLIPKRLLEGANITSNMYNSSFARNPPNALMAVILNRADACGIGESLLKSPRIQQQLKQDQIRIIAKSEPIAHLAWATSATLSEKLRIQIEETLVALKYREAGRSILSKANLSGFRKAIHDDYSSLIKFIEGVK